MMKMEMMTATSNRRHLLRTKRVMIIFLAGCVTGQEYGARREITRIILGFLAGLSSRFVILGMKRRK